MKVKYSKAWCVGMAAKEASSNSEVDAGPLVEIAPDARVGREPCGECHLQAGETCDICGACAENATTA